MESIELFFVSSIPQNAVYKKDIIFMAGLPGSGKSTIMPLCAQDEFDNYCIIDVDRILSHFFNNDRTKYEPAYKILAKWIDFCISLGVNIIFDGTGKDLFDMLKKFKSNGYKTTVCINIVSIDTAKTRAKERSLKQGKDKGRVVADSYFTSVHELLLKNIVLYIESIYVDNVIVYSNEGSQPAFVCKGKESCLRSMSHIYRMHSA